jgi:hypothetical protein
VDEADVLQRIDQLLVDGLATDWTERAYTSEDLNGRLVVAGFTQTPYVAPEDADGIEQSCATCMYFERHRGWCNLAELMLPVKAEWSCILWRI